MNTTTEQIKTRQKRVSFHYISIGDAIDKIETLKAYKGFGAMSIRDALMKMNYAPKSSSGDRALSTMVKSYGLLDQQGTKDNGGIVQLTPLAKKILSYPKDSEQRQSAIKQAVLNDELMQKVFDKWSDGNLPDRKEIIAELQFDPRFGEFTLDAATRFATVIQETFEFPELSKYNGTDVQQEESEEPGDEMLTQNVDRREKTPATPNKLKGFEEYTLTLSKTKEVRLYTSDGLTKDDIDFMMMWIKRLDLERTNSEAKQEVDKNEQE
jgi:hypothetical protein